MGRIIKGQVIASTSVDAHGEALPEEAIRTFFEQLKDPSVSFRNHDTSQAPVCRGFNKRLERLPDSSLAIVIDLEVLDEQDCPLWREPFGTCPNQPEAIRF